jgi:hypothetical protein
MLWGGEVGEVEKRGLGMGLVAKKEVWIEFFFIAISSPSLGTSNLTVVFSTYLSRPRVNYLQIQSAPFINVTC